MHDAFSALLHSLPLAQRRLLLENEDPAKVPLAELLATLGSAERSADDGLRSLRLLRVVRGLPPEPPRTAVTSAEMLRQPHCLSAAACATLRAAVDAAVSAAEPSESGVSTREALADHLMARAFKNQLALSRAELEALIGADAVRGLWKLAASVPLPPGAAGCGDDAPVEISVRRYTPCARPWIPFHNDRACVSLNVALADDCEHDGGLLLCVYDGAVHRVGRAEGEATAHPSTLLHGVSAITSGVRYSLILFFRPEISERPP